LIGVLLLGYVDDSQGQDEEKDNPSYLLPPQMTKDGFAMPVPRPPKVVPSMLPKENHEENELDVDPLDNIK
jgi:hypothetical protein